MHNLLPIHKFIIKEGLDMPELMEERIEQLAELDEVRLEGQRQNCKEKQKEKYLFDKKAKDRNLQEGELVLMWNASTLDKGKHGKFEALWIGPFVITGKNGVDS